MPSCFITTQPLNNNKYAQAIVNCIHNLVSTPLATGSPLDHWSRPKRSSPTGSIPVKTFWNWSISDSLCSTSLVLIDSQLLICGLPCELKGPPPPSVSFLLESACQVVLFFSLPFSSPLLFFLLCSFTVFTAVNSAAVYLYFPGFIWPWPGRLPLSLSSVDFVLPSFQTTPSLL